MTKIVAKLPSNRFSRVMMALVIGGAFASQAGAQSTTSTNNSYVIADAHPVGTLTNRVDFNFGTVINHYDAGGNYLSSDPQTFTTTETITASGVAITGTLSASGLTTTNGILNNGGGTGTGGGITYAGNITGVGLLTASGLITSDSLTTGGISSTSINNSGNISTATLGVTGNASVGGTFVVTGAATFDGATQVNNTLGVTGLITGTGGATITGTTNINATGTATTTIGNTGGTNNLNASTNNIGINLISTDPVTHVSTYAPSANTIGNINTATTVNLAGGNASASIANNAASMSVATGGSFSANATTATMRAGGTALLATNGSTGGNTAALNGPGGVTTYNAAQPITVPTIGGALNVIGKSYQTEINGNLFVDGNVYINGTLDYVSSDSAATTVYGDRIGTSILSGATQATSGGTNIIMRGTNSANESMASMTLTNGIGNTHGIEIYENRTVLSGGTHSTTMTLDDGGAHFRNDATGGPARVTGVADGHTDFDAVNFRQMSRGVAMAAGLAAIPQVEPGKRFSLGAGTGLYHGQSAMAVGGSGRIGSNTIVKGGVSFSLTKNDDPCANFGISHSW